MTTRTFICTAALALLTATSSFAQIGFPSCTGQPVLTGDQSGTVSVGAFATFTDVSFADFGEAQSHQVDLNPDGMIWDY